MSNAEQTGQKPKQWTRREAGRAMLATAAVGAAAPLALASEPPRSLSDLGAYHFTNQDGKPVNMSDLLKTEMTGHDATLTFGFAACTQYCPFINGMLAALDKKAPGRFKHIVIATDPQHDNANQQARNGFKQMIRMMMNEPAPLQDKDNLIILYPPDHATAVAIQIAFDNLVGNALDTHTANVSVFGKTGQRIAKVVPPGIPTVQQNGAGYLDQKAQEYADQVLSKMNGRGL